MAGPQILAIIAGIALLVGGAHLFVRGAAAVAQRLNVPPVLVGLTVVAFGTSLPETAISINAAVGGSGAVALGNAIGSNIFNVLVVLGLSSIIRPLVVDRHLVRIDVPVMVGTSVLALLLALDGTLGRGDGVILLVLSVAYIGFLTLLGRTADAKSTQYAPSDSPPKLPWQLLLMTVGLTLLVVGSRIFVDGATAVARALGVSELVVGLTVVALGTSFPELATSVSAVFQGHRDLAVGNVVGSNIFNVLFVLGCAGAVAPGGIEVGMGVLSFDFPVMLATSVACLPIFFTGWSVDRWEGVVFLAYYVIYVTYLVLHHTDHGAQYLVGASVLYFVGPLTVVTLAVVVTREWRKQRNRSSAAARPPSTPAG